MTLKELKLTKFGGSTKRLAAALNTSEAQVRNWLSNGQRVLELANGNYVIETKHTKIVVVD